MRPLVLAGVLGEWAAALRGDEPDEEQRSVAVNVLDGDRRQIPDLTPGCFRAECGGKPVDILSAALDNYRRHIVVMVDVSADPDGSGGVESEVWDWAREAIRALAPPHQVALFTVPDDRVDLRDFLRSSDCDDPKAMRAMRRLLAQRRVHRSPFLDDPEALDGTLRAKRSRKRFGGSGVYKILRSAAHSLREATLGSAVYLITDRGETDRDWRADLSSERLAAVGARLITVLVRPRQSSFGATFFADALESVTRSTGGLLCPIGELPRDEALASLQKLHFLVSNVYRLVIRLPRRLHRARRWKLSLVDAEGNRRKDVAVVYPELLVPRDDEADRLSL
jgi:hypothetical protein